MTTQSQIAPAPIRKSFAVKATPQRAFEVFVQMGRWWAPSHSIAPQKQADVRIEPRIGGRWYEICESGAECQWGEVVAWEPPHRLVLIWGLGSDWAYDPALRTEIELRFTPEGAGTRVDFEHRKLEAYGARAVEMAGQLGGPDGWTGLLAGFAARFEG